MTTSLTVIEKWFLTRLTSLIGSDPKEKRRWAVMVPLSGVRGARSGRTSDGARGAPPSTRPTRPAVSLTRRVPGKFAAPGSWSTYCRDCGMVASSPTGLSAISRTPRRTRLSVEGIARGTKGAASGATSRGSTVRSMIVSRISAPETPSMAAWWILE